MNPPRSQQTVNSENLLLRSRAAPVLRVAAPQIPTEIPRPRLPTESVGRSALRRLQHLFTPQRRQFQRAADADFEGNPMKSSHFMPFFAQKSPAARLDRPPHQWHASSRPRCWRNGAPGRL